MQALVCAVQNYDWGKTGIDSTVGYLGQHNTGTPVDPAKPYAELWMGTHPSGPSRLADGKGLLDYISKSPAQVLGVDVLARFGQDLPFLFKVLSVAKALSIQAHPDKTLAQKLHANRPDIYKDGNHKPEMAVALSEFEALVGFVDSRELAGALESYPELRTAVGDAESAACVASTSGEAARGAFRAAFTSLMTRDTAVVGPAVDALASRLSSESSSRQLSPREKLVIRLQQEYPSDVGVLASFFLNYLTLQPGEGVYLAANVPHAYLSGECVEVMATSDNVVRAGLTPKLRDTATLCSMLTYSQGPPDVLRGDQQSGAPAGVRAYEPPFEEFALDSARVGAGEAAALAETMGPSVVLVARGAANVACAPGAAAAAAGAKREERAAPAGTVLFLPAHCGVEVAGPADGEGEAVVFRARVNPRGFAGAKEA